MKTNSTDESRVCPKCGNTDNQIKQGFNRSGTQRCKCKECGKTYTLAPKQRAYPREIREQAIRAYYSGVSGRGVGRIFRMNKDNVIRWIKKRSQETFEAQPADVAELDEMYWFACSKGGGATRENLYLCTIVSRNPRQIMAVSVGRDKSPQRIQAMVEAAPPAKMYYSDGYLGYVDIVYPGEYVRNVRDKSDTYTVEGVNADLRHYIAMLRRRSRCFARSLDTLAAVVEVFARAYNRFGQAKAKYREQRKVREVPFSLLDFL